MSSHQDMVEHVARAAGLRFGVVEPTSQHRGVVLSVHHRDHEAFAHCPRGAVVCPIGASVLVGQEVTTAEQIRR